MTPRRALLAALAGIAPTSAGRATDRRTGKERLSDKASDEQRVDDCKVPVARRTRRRSAACARDVTS